MASSTHSPQVEVVINHISSLLNSGRLFPGDRLPAERKLSEQLGVSRIHVRTAFQKLEFYGIVKTYPQSGTVIAEHNVQVLEGMIRDLLKIDGFDFYSLVYVRVLLEVEAIRLSAKMRTEDDIARMKAACDEFKLHADSDRRVEKDFAFHQAVVHGAHNPVISSLLLVITPDVLTYYLKYQVCSTPNEDVIKEHCRMLECIINQDQDGAERCVREHLASIMEFADSVKEGHLKG